jgi:hypothetical protein
MTRQPIGRSPDTRDSADDALEHARNLPPGPERIEALKTAGILRHTADAFGVIFAPRGRPPK